MGDNGGLAETSGGEPVKVQDHNLTLTMVSPTPGPKNYDGSSGAGVFYLGFSLVSQEEKGDILTLRNRIAKNNPGLAILSESNESQEFAKKTDVSLSWKDCHGEASYI